MAVYHGGRLDEAVLTHGGWSKDWLDLSTTINAKAWPVEKVAKPTWQALPQQGELNKLLASARIAYGAAQNCPASAASGSQSHIQMLPFLYKPQTVAVVGFTYQEHGVCWQRAGHNVVVADGLDSAEISARIIIVVNPNNPDGRIIDPTDLATLGLRLASKGGLLLVDEAFGDVAQEASTMEHAGQAGLVVLRSFGKFFGLAGLRLGFAFGPETVIERLVDYLGPWPVSGPAIAVGVSALSDSRWISRTRTRLAADRKSLEELLNGSGMAIVGATDMFVLAKHERALEINQHLAENHILARPFPGRSDWLRFGIPGTKHGINRLEKALAEYSW